MDRRQELTQYVLDQQSRLFSCLRLPHTHDLLVLDLTMQQFKTVVLLGTLESATAGQLARGLGVGLSTMTGIVDRLCERGLVTRGEDPEDRRVTRVALTGSGRDLVERVNSVRREVITRLLSRLSLVQLEHAAEVITALAEAAGELALMLGAVRQQATVLAFADAYRVTFFAALGAFCLAAMLPGRSFTRGPARGGAPVAMGH